MKINCIIVDDEPVARKILVDYAKDVDFLTVVGVSENPLKANELLNNHPVDLMFLDINMPKMSGLDFLRASSSPPMTIIASAYDRYALDGFDLNVVDYLVKPFSMERFLKACNKAKDLYLLKHSSRTKAADHFFVKHDSKIEKVLYDELLYVEAMSNYVILHTESKKLIVYLTLKGIENELPSDQFLRVHKSFVVNKNKIGSIEGNTLHILGRQVPISSNLNEGVMKEILNNRLLKRS